MAVWGGGGWGPTLGPAHLASRHPTNTPGWHRRQNRRVVSHVTRHTSHVTLSDGVRGFFAISAGDNSKRKLGNGREYAGEFTALEWPLVFVAFEKGLVYWCCAAASHGWAITAFSYLYAGSEWIDLTWKLQLQTGEWSEDRRETEYIGRPSQAETLPCLSIYRLDHLVRATGQGRPHTVTTNCNSRTITPSPTKSH